MDGYIGILGYPIGGRGVQVWSRGTGMWSDTLSYHTILSITSYTLTTPYEPLPSLPSLLVSALQGQESTRGWEGYSRVQRVRMVEYDSVVALYTHLYPYTYPIYTPTTIPYLPYSVPTMDIILQRGGQGMDREYRGYSRVTDAGHYYIHLPIHPLLQSYPY